MPIIDGKVFCLNHTNEIMIRQEGFNIIEKLEKKGEKIIIHAGQGIPLVIYYCNICGYIESYIAPKTPFWK